MNHAPTGRLIISIDGACSGKRAACAAVCARGGRVVSEESRFLPAVDGYVLAAELGGVALAMELIASDTEPGTITLESDNPDVPRVIRNGYRSRQAARIPQNILDAAIEFHRKLRPHYIVRPRNTTPGLRRADRLAGQCLWHKRDAARRRRRSPGH